MSLSRKTGHHAENMFNLKKIKIMAEEKKQGRRGRPVTAYKVPLMVRITQEAADMIADVPNKSVYIDELIKKSNS